MIEIRSVSGAELFDTAFALRQYAFDSTPALIDEQALRDHYATVEHSRALVLVEDSRPMATVAGHAMTQNVRGKIVPMSGVIAVAAHPEVRRKGYVRRLMAQFLEEERAAGVAASCLYAFRESFYNRFGYVGLPLTKKITVEVANLTPILAIGVPGTVSLEPHPQSLAAVGELLGVVQQRVHGMAVRRWYPQQGFPGAAGRHFAVARDAQGAISGVLSYRLELDLRELRVGAMLYATPAGRTQLLDWIARHVDQVKVARIPVPVTTYPETWLPDLWVSYGEYESESAMARLLSVPALDGAAAGDAQVTVSVTDPMFPENTAAWTLTGRDGVLTVTGGGTPTCSLTVEGLTALVYGGYDPTDLPLRGWGELDAAAPDALRALFPPAVAHLYEHF